MKFVLQATNAQGHVGLEEEILGVGIPHSMDGSCLHTAQPLCSGTSLMQTPLGPK